MKIMWSKEEQCNKKISFFFFFFSFFFQTSGKSQMRGKYLNNTMCPLVYEGVHRETNSKEIDGNSPTQTSTSKSFHCTVMIKHNFIFITYLNLNVQKYIYSLLRQIVVTGL